MFLGLSNFRVFDLVLGVWGQLASVFGGGGSSFCLCGSWVVVSLIRLFMVVSSMVEEEFGGGTVEVACGGVLKLGGCI